MAIKHAFTSAKDDDADTTVVRPTDWNADHLFAPWAVTLFMAGDLTLWSNMPAALTEFRSILNTRTKLVLTSATQSRVTVRKGGASASTAKIKVQYSADESTWYDLCLVLLITGSNTCVGSWTDVPVGAKADVFIRLVGIDGDDTADPTFGLITLQIK